MSSNNPMVEKVRKLLALSKSSNEAEAQLALQRAQQLIAKYNLDESEVHASGTEDLTLHSVEVVSNRQHFANFEKTLAWAVSRITTTQHILHPY